MNKIVELYTISTQTQAPTNWQTLLTQQLCAYLGRKCLKVRKSAPEISIGTCTVAHGQREFKPVIICPYRLLAQNQIFMDCIHLLSLHEPGNELHIIQEVPIPGGVVDYFLISTRQRKVRDFVGLELQTLDTTGTAWPERQRFLYEKGLITANSEMDAGKSFGMNWKMTAKTTLMQLHHET